MSILKEAIIDLKAKHKTGGIKIRRLDESKARSADEVAQEIAASIWNWTVSESGQYDPYVADILRDKVDEVLLTMQRNAIPKREG